MNKELETAAKAQASAWFLVQELSELSRYEGESSKTASRFLTDVQYIESALTDLCEDLAKEVE